MKHLLLFSFLLSFGSTLFAAFLFRSIHRKTASPREGFFSIALFSASSSMFLLFLAEYLILNVLHDDTLFYALLEAAAYGFAATAVRYYVCGFFCLESQSRIRKAVTLTSGILALLIIMSRLSNHLLGYHHPAFFIIKRAALALLGLLLFYTSCRFLFERSGQPLQRILGSAGILIPCTFFVDVFILRLKLYDGAIRLGMSYPISLTAYLGFCIPVLVILTRRIQRLKNPSSWVDELAEAYNITNREKEIITLVIQGRSNRDIGEALFISLATVKNHLQNIFVKLKITSRFELMDRVLGPKTK
ncbi:MAG: response regulator transcription factor [Spirochaetales bacterium]|nr:response regulator transcription factor [Spirochaetales bacterium]